MLHHEFLPTLPSLLAQTQIPLIHRDLSWLQFNDRVLAESRQANNPLLERAKFLAISSTNLDEFFMIRFANLGREIANLEKKGAVAASHVARIRDNILEQVSKFGAKQQESLDILLSELESEGIRVARLSGTPTGGARDAENTGLYLAAKIIFEEQVLPRIPSPEGFSPGMFSTLENLQLAVVFEKTNLWFKVPRGVPTMFSHQPPGRPGEIWFYFLDDLLLTFLPVQLRAEGGAGVFRLTRDGDVSLDFSSEDLQSLPEAVRTGIRARDKGRVVRLQYGGDVTEKLLRHAATSLRLFNGQILLGQSTLCLAGLWSVFHQTPKTLPSHRPLLYPHFEPGMPPVLSFLAEGVHGEGEKIFAEIRKGDVLFHQPYDSFEGFVRWLEAAAEDPAVEMIEQTIYRMEAKSPLVEVLKKAAKKKRVRIFIELRARFDELNNMWLTEELKSAGAEVIYAFGQTLGKLKLHAKVTLISRREGGELKYYTHLSTGNYNAVTARNYTDLAILTAHPEVGADAKAFMDAVAKGTMPGALKHLVTAPSRLHRRLLSLIGAEAEAAKAGKKARIVAKVNALVDAEVIEHLYKASQAGVQVDLICRGACSAIPGIKGLSENLQVISIVDRYLEHSRLYWFSESRAMYLSSADWMPRNFFSRLEIAFPVLDPKIYSFLEKCVIPAYLADSQRARELTPQGTWKKRTTAAAKKFAQSLSHTAPDIGTKSVRSQFFFQDLAISKYKGTHLL